MKKNQPEQSKVDTMESRVGTCEKETEDEEITSNPYKPKHEKPK